MTPEQRLAAYVEHCRLVAELQRSGRKLTQKTPKHVSAPDAD